MHSSFNTRLTNKNQQQGNVASYFENLKQLIQVNDGTRSFILRTVDCHDQSAPFNSSQETRIAITHQDHMISQISDGFLTFKVKLLLQLTGIASTFTDKDKLCKLFVGFKSSNQILDQLQILSRNLSTGYQQNECVREGFAYSAIKPFNEKKTKKYTHSLYENVCNYSPSICGAYINVDDFKDGQPHEVEFEVNLPFDDILALQAFDMFPNFCCGDIELKFYVKPRGLVWCMLDPLLVKDYKEVIEAKTVSEVPTGTSGKYRHAFTQIDSYARIINNYNETSAESGDGMLQCVSMTITSLKSNMYGFSITADAAEKVMKMFESGVNIPSQQLDYNAFPLAATEAGIQSTVNMPITNTTCIAVMFPKHNNDYTVFENPIYDNVQLTVNGRNIPDEVVSTQGARFLQYQLVASDLSGGLQATKEWEDSIVMARNTETTDHTRYVNCLSDGTSFMLNIQTERNNAGYTFDGIDSNGQNIAVQLKGNPIYNGQDGSGNYRDTYYYCDNKADIHPPPAQIWCCRDTYFRASLQGLEYHSLDTPKGSQTIEPESDQDEYEETTQ